MFDSKTSFSARLADAVDLLLDFATLGEYGLEPVGRPAPSCQTRHRPRPGRPATQRETARGFVIRP